MVKDGGTGMPKILSKRARSVNRGLPKASTIRMVRSGSIQIDGKLYAFLIKLARSR
jgi:hypothetical protein